MHVCYELVQIRYGKLNQCRMLKPVDKPELICGKCCYARPLRTLKRPRGVHWMPSSCGASTDTRPAVLRNPENRQHHANLRYEKMASFIIRGCWRASECGEHAVITLFNRLQGEPGTAKFIPYKTNPFSPPNPSACEPSPGFCPRPKADRFPASPR